MIKLGLTQFEQRLRKVSRCQPIGFTSIVTPSRMRKTNNPLANKVRKVSIGRGMINCLFEAGVNRQRLREGLPADFKAGPPSVGQRIDGCPLCSNMPADGVERFYLEIFVQSVTSHYFCTDDQRELSYFDDVKPFEYSPPANTNFQSNLWKSQGTKKVVRPTTYGLRSIAELRIGGEDLAVCPLNDELHSYLIPVPESDLCDDSAHQISVSKASS